MSYFKVEEGETGERLDIYLVRKLKNISRQDVKELLDSGRVRVNGKRVVIAKWEMIEGDDVEVRLDGLDLSKRKEPPKTAARPEKRREERPRGVFINVVYEDRDVIVVEKPSGAVVQEGDRGSGGGSYVDSLRAYLKRRHGGKGAYVKPVHRLDRETSGLMVFAKSKVGERLIDQFKQHSVKRAYLAVVEGGINGDSGKIDFPLKKGDFGHGRKVNIVRGGEGVHALTEYSVKERYQNATLVRLDLMTGRTHQARVHMAAINHPIVGDHIYGRLGGLNFKRQALHSHFLAFKHPATGKEMQFRSELPDDMKKLVDELRGV